MRFLVSAYEKYEKWQVHRCKSSIVKYIYSFSNDKVPAPTSWGGAINTQGSFLAAIRGGWTMKLPADPRSLEAS